MDNRPVAYTRTFQSRAVWSVASLGFDVRARQTAAGRGLPVGAAGIQSALYSAALRRGEAGRDAYGWVAALPDAIDNNVVRAICRMPVFCHTPTAAGHALIEALREHVTLRAFSLRQADGTIGDRVSASGERGLTKRSPEISLTPTCSPDRFGRWAMKSMTYIRPKPN